MRQGKRGEEKEKGRDIQQYATGSCLYTRPVHVVHRQDNQLALRNGRGTIPEANLANLQHPQPAIEKTERLTIVDAVTIRKPQG